MKATALYLLRMTTLTRQESQLAVARKKPLT